MVDHPIKKKYFLRSKKADYRKLIFAQKPWTSDYNCIIKLLKIVLSTKIDIL